MVRSRSVSGVMADVSPADMTVSSSKALRHKRLLRRSQEEHQTSLARSRSCSRELTGSPTGSLEVCAQISVLAFEDAPVQALPGLPGLLWAPPGLGAGVAGHSVAGTKVEQDCRGAAYQKRGEEGGRVMLSGEDSRVQEG